MKTKAMNTRTRLLLTEIKKKAKNPITGNAEFVNLDSVIDIAVRRLYESLKQQKLI